MIPHMLTLHAGSCVIQHDIQMHAKSRKKGSRRNQIVIVIFLRKKWHLKSVKMRVVTCLVERDGKDKGIVIFCTSVSGNILRYRCSPHRIVAIIVFAFFFLALVICPPFPTFSLSCQYLELPCYLCIALFVCCNTI